MFVHLLRIFFSVWHFPVLSWTVVDLPCFSEVVSFTSWYVLLLLFTQATFDLITYRVLLCFLFRLLNPLLCIILFLPLHTNSSLIFSFHHRGWKHVWWSRAFPSTFWLKYLSGFISYCFIVVESHGSFSWTLPVGSNSMTYDQGYDCLSQICELEILKYHES